MNQPAKEEKGSRLGGPCNVSACQAPGATNWNTSTLAWYCDRCAKNINEVVMSTPPLCVPSFKLPPLASNLQQQQLDTLTALTKNFMESSGDSEEAHALIELRDFLYPIEEMEQ